MGKIKTALLAAILFLFSCSSNSEKIYTYHDVDHLKIPWENALKAAETQYFVYIYSVGCLHCNSIKNRIISFALDERNIALYFVIYEKEINITLDPQVSLGATSVSDIYIKGTPSLLEIIDWSVFAIISGSQEIISFLNI